MSDHQDLCAITLGRGWCTCLFAKNAIVTVDHDGLTSLLNPDGGA